MLLKLELCKCEFSLSRLSGAIVFVTGWGKSVGKSPQNITKIKHFPYPFPDTWPASKARAARKFKCAYCDDHAHWFGGTSRRWQNKNKASPLLFCVVLSVGRWVATSSQWAMPSLAWDTPPICTVGKMLGFFFTKLNFAFFVNHEKPGDFTKNWNFLNSNEYL